MILFNIFFLYTNLLFAQVEPTVTFDPATGNYIIEYEGYVGDSQEPVLIHVIFEPSTKIEPLVGAVAVKINNINYKYEYTVTNSSSSIQRMQEFDLEIHSSITDISSPDEFWKSSSYTFVPVFGWYNSKGEAGLSHLFNGIAPDSSESGFSFVSSGLPTISNAYFSGKVTIYLTFPDEPPGEIDELLKPLIKFPNNSVIKKTIGPKDPPIPFEASSFLDTLINYCTQSFALNWISDSLISAKYTTYFQNAKSHVQQNNNTAAIAVLDSVLTDVEADSGVTLSSEAYALIKYNTEYLKEQLSQTK